MRTFFRKCGFKYLKNMFNVIYCVAFNSIGTSTSSETETQRDKKMDMDVRTITGYTHYGQILVILVGMVLSLAVLLLIAREMFKLFRKSETSGNYHVAMVAPVVNNTCDDITVSLYNSRGISD